MKDFCNRVIAKLLSVRLWVTLIVIWTLRTSVVNCFDLIKMALEKTDEKLLAFVKEISLFILGCLVTTVATITTLYFTRNDRWKNENGETNEKENVK